MTDVSRTFAVASDLQLEELIKKAHRRLVVVSPALTDRVADALAERLDELGSLHISVILDADPEVYRLGYGTASALERLRQASERTLFDLRVQAGVRIGVIISDDTTMVFSPVPQLIEAGSISAEKPNAIILSGNAADRLAEAAGGSTAETEDKREIGTEPLTPAAAEAVKESLRANPPQQFDVARALRVFSSKVQYVELEVNNYRFSSRQVPLPPELMGISDDQLKQVVSGRIRAASEGLGKLKIDVRGNNGTEAAEVDDKWLDAERKRIQDEFTFIVPRFGRVILYADRNAFEKEMEIFKENLTNYYKAAMTAVEGRKADFEDRLMREYLPRWLERPPGKFKRYGVTPTPDILEKELRLVIGGVLQKAITFEPPQARVVYKNIAPESVRDTNFLEPLKNIMLNRNVPRTIVDSLFRSGEAAPAVDQMSLFG